MILRIKGENIFSFNLDRYEKYLKANSRIVKKLHVIKKFPDTVVIEAQGRLPLMQISNRDAAFYLVDNEGVILKGPVPFVGRHLMQVNGFSSALDLRIGKKIANYRMQKALEVVKILQKTNVADAFDVANVDVSNTNNIMIVLEGGTEIYLGHSEFLKRLHQLARATKKIDFSPEKIKYVDLRFDDMVIGSR